MVSSPHDSAAEFAVTPPFGPVPALYLERRLAHADTTSSAWHTVIRALHHAMRRNRAGA